MGILHTLTCLLLSATPQSQPGPAAQPTTTNREVLQFANLFAQDTTALLVLNPLHEQWTELKQTGLGKIFAERGWLEPLAAGMRADMQGFEERTGITSDQWIEVLKNGMAVGWSGVDAGGTPMLEGVVGLGSAATVFRDALQEWAQELQKESPTSARAELWKETQVWEIRRGFSMSFAVHGSMLVFGSSRDLVEGMLRRSSGDEGDSLAGTSDFRSFVFEIEKRPVWSCYLRPGLFVRQLAELVPEQKEGFSNAARALRLGSIQHVAFTAHVENGEIVEHLRARWPAPQEGLLGALMGNEGRIDADLARWVPDAATSFGFAALDPGEITHELIALLHDVAPDAGTAVVAGLDRMYDRLGFDLQEDLLATVGDRSASMQWRGPAGETRTAMVFALRDDLRFLIAWDKLRGAFPIQPVSGNQTDQRLYRVTLPTGPQATTLSAAVTYGFLFVADSDDALKELLERVEATPGTQVGELLANSDTSTTLISHTDLTAALRTAWPTLQAAMGPAGIDLDPRLARHFGVLRSIARRDETGFSFESRSPVGGFQGALVLTLVSSIALPQLIAARGTADAAPSQDEISIVARLQAIHSAQARFRASDFNDEDGDGKGEYGTLDELLAAGAINADVLGKVDPDGTVAGDEYITTVLLPPTTDGRETHFAAIAWPAGARPGPVYCVLPTQPVLVNEILAGTAGMTAVDPRDVFLGGLFGNELTAGWRTVEPEVVRTAKTIDIGSPVQVLRAVEESADPQEADRVAPLLGHQDPQIASRAAWLLGQLKAKDAVPQLCDVVKDNFDDEVRKHAMAALVRMGDRRSLKTSMVALGDTDSMVRSLAATNLGKIRSREAVEPLIGLLDERAGAEGDTQNVVAALLALHDIGDTEALLPAASAIEMTDEATGTALSFLYQELSPRLPPEEEASVLLAVLDHPQTMLRRYAIQRLGELRLSSTARALEGRLAAEDEALQPLVRVSLAAVRGDDMQDADWLMRAEHFAKSFWNKAQNRWARLSSNQRTVVLAGAGGFLLIVIVLIWARGRSRRKLRADKVAAMVAPSRGFQSDQGQDDYEYGEEEYYEDDAYSAEEPADTYHR